MLKTTAQSSRVGNEEFKRTIGSNSLLLLSFGAIFGSGWLFTPYYAAKLAGPGSLLAWILGAILSSVVGLTIAEVVSIFPRTGGLSKVVLFCFGEELYWVSTIFNLWVCLLLPVIEVRAVLQYLDSANPLFLEPEGGLTLLGYFVGSSLLAFVVGLNSYGSKIVTRVTNISVFIKLIVPLLICACFLFVLRQNHALHLGRLTDFQDFGLEDIFLALSTSGIIFSFNGFNQATLFAGEARNPQKSIPYAILGSILMAGLLYVAIQAVFLLAIPEAGLQNGWKNIFFEGDHGPFIGLSTFLGLGWLASIVYVDAAISPLGTALAYGGAGPRMLYLLSDGVSFLKPLRRLNQAAIPINCILLALILEMLSLAFFSSLRAMISILVAAFVLCYTFAPASLLIFRRHFNTIEHRFSLRYPVLTSTLAIVFGNWMVFSCGWTAIRNLLCASLIPALIVFARISSQKVRNTDWMARSGWFLFQVFILAFCSYATSSELISFKLGLILVAAGSVFSLFLSVSLYRRNSGNEIVSM